MEHLESSIVGEQTYGKGIMQSTYTFLDGSTLTLTVAYYNPPSGENYHNVGIEPNVICDNMETALDDAYTEIYKLLK
jgi:carboxyl-terminal processing protease